MLRTLLHLAGKVECSNNDEIRIGSSYLNLGIDAANVDLRSSYCLLRQLQSPHEFVKFWTSDKLRLFVSNIEHTTAKVYMQEAPVRKRVFLDQLLVFIFKATAYLGELWFGVGPEAALGGAPVAGRHDGGEQVRHQRIAFMSSGEADRRLGRHGVGWAGSNWRSKRTHGREGRIGGWEIRETGAR